MLSTGNTFFYTATEYSNVQLDDPPRLADDDRIAMNVFRKFSGLQAQRRGSNDAQGTFGQLLANDMRDCQYNVVMVPLRQTLATALLRRTWHILHAVIVSRRIDRHRVLGPEPTMGDLKKLRDEVKALKRPSHCIY